MAAHPFGVVLGGAGGNAGGKRARLLAVGLYRRGRIGVGLGGMAACLACRRRLIHPPLPPSRHHPCEHRGARVPAGRLRAVGAFLLGFRPAWEAAAQYIMPMPKSLSLPLAVLAVTAVAALSGCSNSTDSTEAADKPNFTGTAPSSSAAAASETEAESQSSATDSPAEETTTKAAADKDENDADKDAEGGGDNKIIPVEALDSLWVPALCDNQAGNLEGGQLPQHLKTGMLFDVAAAGLKLNQDDTPKGAYADINGDGRDEAVITYVCNKGGTGWPDNLLIYDNDLNYITKVDDWEREGMPPARGHVQQLQWTEDTVTVTWRAYGPDDAACCATQEFTGNLTLDAATPHLAVTGHQQVAG